MIASFLTGVLLARMLGPEGFGLYGTVMALALMLSGVAQAGLPTLTLREVAVSTDTHNWPLLRGVLYWFPRVILGTSAVVAALYLLALWVYPIISGNSLPRELLYAAALVPLFALASLIYAELRGLHQYIRGQSLDILVRPVLFLLCCLGIYILAGGLSPERAVLLQIPVALIAVALGFHWRRLALPKEAFVGATASHPRAWSRAAIPLATSDAFVQLNAVYGLLIVSAVAAPAEAGFLRVALSTIVFVATPLSAVHVILGPRLAQLHAAGRHGELQSLLAIGATVMFGFTLVAFAIIYMAGEPLLEAFFGPAYRSAWQPLLLLTAAQAIMGFFGAGWLLLSVAGGERKLTLAYAVSTPLAIAAACALVPGYGATGAAAAAVLGTLVQNLVCWRFLRRAGLDCSVFGLFRRRSGRTPLHGLRLFSDESRANAAHEQ
jgi:O-antigen/teichoic acid export membrane protein